MVSLGAYIGLYTKYIQKYATVMGFETIDAVLVYGI